MDQAEETAQAEETPQPPVCSPYLICDNCVAYPLMPVHGHYVCPECKLPTKCCEGGPQEL
jgi:hypothetical protein